MSDKSKTDHKEVSSPPGVELDKFLSIEHYALNTRNQSAENFRSINATAIKETLREMSGPHALNMLYITHYGNFTSSRRFDTFAVLLKSVDILISAFHMACQRQQAEACTLLRLALETAATGWDISQNQSAFEDYKQMRYKSTSAVKFAKKVVPSFGELWGAMSRMAVHPNAHASGPRRSLSDDGRYVVSKFELSFDLKLAKPEEDEIVLTLISLCANIVLRLTEEAIMEPSESGPGWFDIPGTKHLYFCDTDGNIEKCYDRITALSAPPKKSE